MLDRFHRQSMFERRLSKYQPHFNYRTTKVAGVQLVVANRRPLSAQASNQPETGKLTLGDEAFAKYRDDPIRHRNGARHARFLARRRPIVEPL